MRWVGRGGMHDDGTQSTYDSSKGILSTWKRIFSGSVSDILCILKKQSKLLFIRFVNRYRIH